MTYSIIAVAGLAGSGKNTVGSLVAKKLGWRLVEPTFKDLARREGVSLEAFQKKAAADPHIDLKFDQELKRQCEGGHCVVSTWLGPWMAPGGVFKVWLDVSLDERARRVAGRESQDVAEAKARIFLRDAQNVARYQKAYGIDILDHSKFDLVIDADHSTPSRSAARIIQGAGAKPI
ncbi:MAG: cytidylate kinase family protein [Candidatus Micrarchaeota archaeon]